MLYEPHVIALIVVFAIPIVILFIYSVGDGLRLKKQWYAKKALDGLRFWSMLPFAFYGGLSLDVFVKNERRVHGSASNGEAPASARAALGLHGVTGVILIPYAVISAWLILQWYTNKRCPAMHGDLVMSDYHSRRLFYVFLCDLLLVAGLLSAVALGGSWIPWLMSSCTNKRIQSDSILRAVAGSLSTLEDTTTCHEMVVERNMAVCLIIFIGVQAWSMFEVVDLPRWIQGPLVLLIHKIRAARRPYRASNLISSKQAMSLFEKASAARSLASILCHDKTVQSLALNLHYSDFVNLSLTSKTARYLVFGTDHEASQRRLGTLRSLSCTPGNKSSCWACARTICSDCHYATEGPPPRSDKHQKNCYPVCTRCYLTSNPAQNSSLYSAWHGDDLSQQHKDCDIPIPLTQRHNGVRRTIIERPPDPNSTFDICQVCRGGAQIDEEKKGQGKSQYTRDLREARHVKLIRRALKQQGVKCASCDTDLPGGSTRWWICGLGCKRLKEGHECYWEGHYE